MLDLGTSNFGQQACLGLEGENRQLREQIAELEKQPLQKATVKALSPRCGETDMQEFTTKNFIRWRMAGT